MSKYQAGKTWREWEEIGTKWMGHKPRRNVNKKKELVKMQHGQNSEKENRKKSKNDIEEKVLRPEKEKKNG